MDSDDPTASKKFKSDESSTAVAGAAGKEGTDEHASLSSEESVEMNSSKSDGFEKQNDAIMTRNMELPAHEIIGILKAAEKPDFKYSILSDPPVKPKAGKVFLYRKKSVNDKRFLDDQYFGFRNFGRNIIQKRLTKTYYKMQLRPDGSSADAETSMKRKSVDFSKTTYWLNQSMDVNGGVVLVHYLGNEQLYIHQSHGNSKQNRPYTRTSRDTKDKIKELVKDRDNGPKKVYQKLVREAFKETPLKTAEECIIYEPIDTPRDLEQVKNFKKQQTRETKISKCEITSVYDMANSDLKDFILKLELVPLDIIIFAEPTTLKIANELLKQSRKHPEVPQLLTYDTTFELGDTYVSILVMRNTMLHGDPIFPVAFLIHDRKLKKVHKTFWEVISEKLDLSLLANSTPICTDREQGIVSAIQEVVDSGILLPCTNHLKRDVAFWLTGKKSEDVAVLSQQISLLLESENLIELTEMLTGFKEKWSEEYRRYFETSIQNDVIKSAKFNAERFAAFKDCLPTSNIGESVNSVIKGNNDGKELPVDALVLKLIELQCGHLSEFFRAQRNTGRYRVKKEFIHLNKWEQPKYVHHTENEFTATVKSSTNPSELICPNQHLSNELRAKRCIEMKLFAHLPDLQLFVLISPYSSQSYTVRRNPKAKSQKREFICSCTSGPTCWHITAVQISIGDTVFNETVTHKLSVVKKTARGFKGRLGRKKPNLQDVMANLEEADDSELARRKRKFQEDTCCSSNADNWKRNDVVDYVPVNFSQELYSPDDERDTAKDELRIQNDELDYQNENTIRDTTPILVLANQNNFVSNQSVEDEFEMNFEKECNFDLTKEEDRFKRYPTLKSGWLEGSLIDGVINHLLQSHSIYNVMYINELMYQSVYKGKNASQVAFYSHHRGGLNKDVVLVCVGDGCHWMLGTVILGSKTICLFDSLYNPTKRESRTDHFQSLLMIAQAIFGTDGVTFAANDWTLCYASDSPPQLDGTECGVIVCLMVYAFLNKLPFPTAATLKPDRERRNRRWMLKMLEARKEEPDFLENRRMPRGLKKFVSETFQQFPIHPESVQLGQCRTLVLDSIVDDGSWSVCHANSCPGDIQHVDEQILCVNCRNWFHLTCVNTVKANLPSYFRCTKCVNI